MINCKFVSVTLGNHIILSKDQSPIDWEEKDFINGISHSNIIGSVIYLMVYTRSDVAFTTSMLSRYMSNPGFQH